MKRITKLRAITFLLIAGTLAVAAGTARAKESDNDTIYAGVYLDGVYVGGLTKEEAMEEYDKYIDGIDDLKITFATDVGTCSTTLKDLGVSVSVEDAVDKAYNYGRQGNILSRYKEIKALEAENVVLVPEKEFNEDSLKEYLENETGDITKDAKNASIDRVDGEFVVYKGEVGTSIDVDKTVKKVEDVFAAEWEQKDIKIDAAVDEKEPQYTSKDFYSIDSVLGQGSTEYSQGNTERCQNLATGASKISGTVLMPGESFSMLDTVLPFTEENGYANAGQYEKDDKGSITLVDGLGGGICQVSTTLYLAVLRAELDVNERYPHTFPASYVKHGMDAAISENANMNFRFTNNTEYPIYIDGYAGGGTISFAIYGHETRPSNRTIEFESIDVETTDPGDPEEEKDSELEEGTRVTERAAHTGYYVELWKHVYVDGEETEKYIVDYGRSNYQAQKALVKIGTKKVKKKDKDDSDSKSNSSGKDKKATEATTEAPATETPTTETPTEPVGNSKKESEE